MATKKTTIKKDEDTDEGADKTPLPPGEKDPWASVVAAEDLKELDRMKVLLYGPSGAGKSRIGALFGKRPLIGLTEHQAIPTIRLHNPQAQIRLIKTPLDLHNFRLLCRSPDLAKRVDAVVLDSGTDAQRILRGYFTGRQGSKAGREKTSMESFGLTIDATARLARELRDLPVHVCMMFLDSEIDVEGEGMVHRPNVVGKKLPQDLAQYFNVVGFVHVSEQPGGLRHQVMFRGPDRWMTKGMEGLDNVEPPEPVSWLMKTGKAEIDADSIAAVDERVSAWKALENEDGGAPPVGDSDDKDPLGPAADA